MSKPTHIESRRTGPLQEHLTTFLRDGFAFGVFLLLLRLGTHSSSSTTKALLFGVGLMGDKSREEEAAAPGGLGNRSGSMHYFVAAE